MPEAVCDSRKSGVERNVLGRLLTLTCIYVSFIVINPNDRSPEGRG